MGNNATAHHRLPQPQTQSPMESSPKPQLKPQFPSPRLPPRLGLTHGRVLGRPLDSPENNIRNHFEFVRVLGRGQFGVTYLISHKQTGEQFACKSIAARRLVNKEAIEDVRREIQILHHLTGHRNIVELTATYEDRNAVYLVMELCGGGELFQRIIERGTYSEKKAAELCRGIVTVIHNCHSLGVMHRDLKPENFLFSNKDEDSLLKACDFGLSTFFKPGKARFLEFMLAL